jgi:hypothetical protein
LLALSPVSTVFAQGSIATVNAQPSMTSPGVGQTLTVNVTISNVQNLYGVDVTLSWNTSVLKVLSATSLLGVESHPTGVLHESILVVEDSASQQAGEYTLVATSQGSAGAFSGSGTIATVTFNVTSVGHSALELETELSDHPAPGDSSNLINHNDVSGSVDVSIPEFSTIAALVVFLALATGALVFSKKHMNKTKVKTQSSF